MKRFGAQPEAAQWPLYAPKTKRKHKQVLTTSLDNLTFLTEEDKNKLFEEFETIRQIKIAKLDDLTKVLGKRKAQKLIDAFDSL